MHNVTTCIIKINSKAYKILDLYNLNPKRKYLKKSGFSVQIFLRQHLINTSMNSTKDRPKAKQNKFSIWYQYIRETQPVSL